MGVMATKKMHCSCGAEIEEVLVTAKWKDQTGLTHTIFNVPSLQCTNDDCGEVMYKAKVQVSLSWYADQLRKGKLPISLNYKHVL